MHLITASITPELRTLTAERVTVALRQAVRMPVEHVYVRTSEDNTLVGAFVAPGPGADMTACVQATSAVLGILAGPDHVVQAEVRGYPHEAGPTSSPDTP